MNIFLAETIKRTADELNAAMGDHVANYPGGDWRAANDRIGVARYVADAALRAARLWPSGERYLSNETVLRILRSVGTSTVKVE